jgi:hypothetical protein
MPDADPDRDIRRKYLLGWGLGFAFYTLLLALSFLQGLHNQFGNIKIVDEKAEEQYKVAWVDSGRKLQYPSGFFAPLQTKSLAEIEKLQELEAKRKLERERRRALAEARRRANDKSVANADKDKGATDKNAQGGNGDTASANAGGTSSDASQQTKAPDAKTPSVSVNVFPLRTHIDEVVDKYREGKLKVNPNALHGTIGITLKPNGDFDDVKILSSSGSKDADEVAKAFLKELLAQSGMKSFLAQFNSIKITVDANNSDVTLSVTGNMNGGVDATAMAGLIAFAAMGKKSTVPKDSNTAKVLNNLKVQHSGSQVTATISLPRSMANDVLRDFGKKVTAAKT